MKRPFPCNVGVMSNKAIEMGLDEDKNIEWRKSLIDLEEVCCISQEEDYFGYKDCTVVTFKAGGPEFTIATPYEMVMIAMQKSIES